MSGRRERWGVGLVAALLLACGPSFDPASLLTGPRLVALVAEPPELGFSGTAVLTAVVTDPAAVAEAAFGVCPVSTGSLGGYACKAPELPLASDGLTATLDTSAFGEFLAALSTDFSRYAPGLKATLASDEACLERVLADWEGCGGDAGCDATAGEAAVACLRADGIDAMVHVRLRFVEGEPFDTYKRVRLRDATLEHPANANPRLTGVRVGPADRPDDGVTVVAGGAVEVAAGQDVRLEPLLDEGSIESWVDADGPHTELVSFSWFTPAGSFDYGRSTADVPDVTLSVPAPSDDDWASSLALWVVARDDRYGMAALPFTLTVVDRGATP